MENDFHQVGADIGDLREDTTADSQGARAEGFTDGEADEAGADQVWWDVAQDGEHEEELDADQHKADAHSGSQADVHDIERFSAEGRKGRPGIGHGVDPDAEPGHAVGTENAQD
ncbi:MAG: hypothetical protein A4E72_00136 [Syntrophus sp. PtaU1.Bin208]|nr:MAG: hypothetical protein A4E72_00136 [Syntrophus sp. PtaU1.Bin208]